jgi:hypothetical protein
MLSVTTPDLWPMTAKRILEDKGVNPETVKSTFENVVFPWDNEYNTQRNYFSLRIQVRPLMIVKPTNTNEIEAVLDFVKEKSLIVQLMNGRHTTNMVDSEVLVDLSFMNKVRVRGDEIVCGGGSTQGRANDVLFENGEHYSHFGHPDHPRIPAFAGGSAATVGVGGITSVGGVGVLARTFGLTVDHVNSYTITLPPNECSPSRTIKATKDQNADLFWALRGGGANNFGVVSKIRLSILEVPELIKYNVVWPWTNATRVLDYWRHSSMNRPRNYDEEMNVSKSTTPSISLTGYYVVFNNESVHESQELIRRELGPLVTDFDGRLSFTRVKYSDLYRTLVENRKYFNFSVIQAFFVQEFSPANVVELVDGAVVDDGFVSISLQLLGGAIRDVQPNETAFFPREANFFVDIATSWFRLHSSQNRNTWCNSAVLEFLRNVENTVYLGFPLTYTNVRTTNRVYYGDNYRRLQEVKATYDPLNLLSPCGTL